jgi:hypothetical protein
MDNYSIFKTDVVDLGDVKLGQSVLGTFDLVLASETSKYLYAVPDCGCTGVSWNANTLQLLVNYTGEEIPNFYKELGMVKLPKEKGVSVFIEEPSLGIVKEHRLTIKYTLIE